MNKEAAETEKRAKAVAGTFSGKKSAITKEAQQTKQKASKMMQTYLDRGSDALDGFEFITMAEAGEVGHWQALGQLGQKSKNAEVRELVAWALPIQERHFKQAQTTTLKLARQEDPDGEA